MMDRWVRVSTATVTYYPDGNADMDEADVEYYCPDCMVIIDGEAVPITSFYDDFTR